MKKEKITNDVWIMDDFLSHDECAFHIKASEVMGYEFAKVNINGKQTVMPTVRDNQRVLLFDEEMAEEMWTKLVPFIDDFPMAKPVGLNEMWRYYRYVPGERFKLHLDGSHRRNEKERSLLTLLIYLNDDFIGGATGFLREFDIEPKKGRAVIFNHSVRHEGKPIQTGMKYVLRTDVMFKFETGELLE